MEKHIFIGHFLESFELSCSKIGSLVCAAHNLKDEKDYHSVTQDKHFATNPRPRRQVA